MRRRRKFQEILLLLYRKLYEIYANRQKNRLRRVEKHIFHTKNVLKTFFFLAPPKNTVSFPFRFFGKIKKAVSFPFRFFGKIKKAVSFFRFYYVFFRKYETENT